ncbi:MAG: efflux RND transporter permease subunit [Polyangiaceae bacterium]
MNISEIAIKRPVFTVMLTVAVLVLGLVGLKSLGTDLFPDVSFPVVVVTVPYPGASPTEVENLVTKQVEDSVISLNGIDRVRTFSREGASQTMVIFKLGVDISDAAAQVRERVAGVRYKFPTDTKEPTIGRFDVSASPVLTYTLETTGSLSAARKYADDVLKPALEQVDGVAAVEVNGGAAREIRVELDRTRLNALGLDAGTVVQRLRMDNLNVPAGHFDEGRREISVRTIGEFQSVESIRDVIVTTAKDGSAVRLRDVAKVEDAFEDVRTRVRVNGKEAVSFAILKQSGLNTVAVSDGIKARLAVLEQSFPAGMKSSLIIDQSRFIKNSVDQVQHDIVFGGGMAILIILVFMLDLRSTLISSVALPTSVIGTFFLMYVLDYTMNMMTLLGLSLAIGLLIDDAVVVRENIFKHLERGKSPRQAALDGTKEIALSVLATTLTIVAVFIPVAFVKGMVGQFFRQFGITVSGAVVLSLFVAFTLDPMLSSRFSHSLDEKKNDSWKWLKRPFEFVFDAMDETYRGILRFATRNKLIIGGLAIGSLFFMGFIAKLTGSEFVNAEDRGQYIAEFELPAGTSLDETTRISTEAEKKMFENPENKVVFATLGPNGEVNKAKWRIVTSRKDQRKQSLAELKGFCRDILAKIPGAKVAITDPPFAEGAATEAPIMIDVRGQTYGDIAPLAQKVAKILSTTPGIQDIQVKYSPGRPELQVEIDRQRAADKGIPVAQVALALRSSMEGDEAGRFRQGKDEIPIRVHLEKSARNQESDVANITLVTPKGPVKLGDVATLSRGEGPQVIERENRSRQIQVWAAPLGRPLGDIVKDIDPQIKALELPTGASIVYDGQIKMMGETNSNMGLALMLGVVFIYIILASQFESFIHPLTIMLTLPLAFVGAILGLFLTNNTMAMGAMIGIILLMGLVTKNAILLIDRALVRVRELGETPLQAILEAGPERLRPILMTSAAMVLGMLPTAVGKSEGSEFRAPMAIAVIGGVISSTLLSLVVVPVFYLAIEGVKARIPFLRRMSESQTTSLDDAHGVRAPSAAE